MYRLLIPLAAVLLVSSCDFSQEPPRHLPLKADGRLFGRCDPRNRGGRLSLLSLARGMVRGFGFGGGSAHDKGTVPAHPG